MSEGGFRFVVRTPHGVVFDQGVRSVRLPTISGQVGLRVRMEPCLLTAEPGLILVRHAATRFMASVGGLVRCDRHQSQLLTPLAVIADARAEVISRLDAALEAPGVDVELRRLLVRLETGILSELRGAPAAARGYAKG